MIETITSRLQESISSHDSKCQQSSRIDCEREWADVCQWAKFECKKQLEIERRDVKKHVQQLREEVMKWRKNDQLWTDNLAVTNEMRIDRSTALMIFNFIWLSSYRYAEVTVLEDIL